MTRWVMLALLVGMAGCGGSAPMSSPSRTTTAPAPVTTSARSEDPPASTTTGPAAPELVGPIGAAIEGVVADDSGLWLLLETAPLRLWEGPTAIGFAVGDELVVGQLTTPDAGLYPPPREGPVWVVDHQGLREIAPPDGFDRIELHDAGLVEGRVAVLVTVATRANPETAEERLLLWDPAGDEWRDLGVSGGWESGVRQARLVGRGVAALLFGEGEGNEWIELRALDGSVSWQIDIGRGAIAWSGSEILVVEAGFDESFAPLLELRSLEAGSGTETDHIALELVLPEELSIDGGFCFVVEWTGSELLCDQTYGGPLLIDPGGGRVRSYRDLEEGVATVAR